MWGRDVGWEKAGGRVEEVVGASSGRVGRYGEKGGDERWKEDPSGGRGWAKCPCTDCFSEYHMNKNKSSETLRTRVTLRSNWRDLTASANKVGRTTESHNSIRVQKVMESRFFVPQINAVIRASRKVMLNA